MLQRRRLDIQTSNSAVHISAAEKSGILKGTPLSALFCFMLQILSRLIEDFAFGKISLGGANCITAKLILMRHLRPKNESPEGMRKR